MLAMFAAAGLIAGLVAGGSFKNITSPGLRGLWLPVLSLVCESAARRLCLAVLPRDPWFAVLLSAAYALSFAFILLNAKPLLFFVPALLGAAGNFLVIALNDFYMPVSSAILSEKGYSIPASQAVAYRVADSSTRLTPLSDLILWPWPRGFASLGDLLLGTGVFFAAVYLLKPGCRLFRK